MGARRVLVLVHQHGSLTAERYYMREVAELLRADGVEVVVAHGPSRCVPADLAVLHVDLTKVPPDYVRALQQYPRVVNGALLDISKRSISSELVTRGNGYEGPVIVKSDSNCGGVAEAVVARRRGLRSRVHGYQVFGRCCDVPQGVWSDPALVVERFLPERVFGGLYRLRLWKFCGDAETLTYCYSHDPIVKGSNVFRREERPTTEVPELLRSVRARLGADFGKFDYATFNGETVLFDVNRTPTITRPQDEELPRIRAFADALKGWLQ